MLTVKTHIGNSQIHGTGIFASEFIPRGTLIWKLQKGFDIILTKDQFFELPILTQDFITHFSYYDKELNCHVLCGDHARFFNKSETPNCGGEKHDETIALRDIEQGEELTEIYFNLKEIEEQFVISIVPKDLICESLIYDGLLNISCTRIDFVKGIMFLDGDREKIQEYLDQNRDLFEYTS